MNSIGKITFYVYITYYENNKLSINARKHRIKYLANLLLNIAYINVREVHIKVFTNSSSKELNSIFDPISAKNSEKNSTQIIHVREESLINNLGEFEPHLLTWSHKSILREDYYRSPEDSYFIYLEDDAIFTQSNLEYFISHREQLQGIGLIPSFLRVEWSNIHSEWINSDSFERLPNAKQKEFIVHGENIYMEIKNPYCALILLDKELAQEYLSSESSNVDSAKLKHDFIWDTAATSALGLIAEKIPNGHSSRTVIALGSDSMLPLIGSIVRHQGDKYANEIWWRHFRAFDYYSKHDLPIPSRNIFQKLKRVLKDPKILFNYK